MEKKDTGSAPVMRLHVNDSTVTVMFSNQEESDVKNRVRDILTEAYEERFQRESLLYGQA